GRNHQHRAARRQQRRGEQVVRSSVSCPGQKIGGGGSDYDEIRLLTEPHVRHLLNIGEDSRAHWLPRQRFERRRANELQRRLGRHHPNPVARLGQPAKDLAGLVRGDTTSDPENHVGLVLGTVSGHSPSVCSSTPAWISRSAIDNGFSRGPGSTSGPTYSSRPSPSCA